MSGASLPDSTYVLRSKPELCVFDLDACLWDKEMFQMSDVPAPVMAGQQNNTYCSPSTGRG